MRRTVRLTERDLSRIVRRVIKEDIMGNGTIQKCVKELEDAGFRDVPPVCMAADATPEACALALAKQNMRAAKEFAKCAGQDIEALLSKIGNQIATKINDVITKKQTRCYPEVNPNNNTVSFPTDCFPEITGGNR